MNCYNCQEAINGEFYISECLQCVHHQCYLEIVEFNNGNCDCAYDKHMFYYYDRDVGPGHDLKCEVHADIPAQYIADDMELYCDKCLTRDKKNKYTLAQFFDELAPIIVKNIRDEKTKLYKGLHKCNFKILSDEYQSADKQLDIFGERISLITAPPSYFNIQDKYSHMKMILGMTWPQVHIKYLHLVLIIYHGTNRDPENCNLLLNRLLYHNIEERYHLEYLPSYDIYNSMSTIINSSDYYDTPRDINIIDAIIQDKLPDTKIPLWQFLKNVVIDEPNNELSMPGYNPRIFDRNMSRFQNTGFSLGSQML